MATKIVTKNSSTASAVPTASDLLQGELAVNVADKRLFTEDNAGAIVELGTNPSTLTVTGEITANGGIALGDNDKATFGAGDDLQIYHNGSNSYIQDVGTGSLILRSSTATIFQGNTAGENQLTLAENGAVTAYYDNAAKLATEASGISVTGTAEAHKVEIGDGSAGGTSEILFSDNVSARGKILYDHSSSPETMLLQTTGTTAISIDNSQNISIPNGNLDVTGTATMDTLEVSTATGSATPVPTEIIIKSETSASDWSDTLPWGRVNFYSQDGSTNGPKTEAAIDVTKGGAGGGVSQLSMRTCNSTTGSLEKRISIEPDGDISFYEDTGTTPKLFWDASAESLGIGTSSPQTPIEISGTKNTSTIRLRSTTNDASWSSGDYYGRLEFWSDDDSGVGAGAKGSIVSASVGGSGSTAYMAFNVASTTTNDIERLRIDSSGNVGIGTSSPSSILSISGTDTTAYSSSSVGGQDSAATLKIQNLTTSANSFASIDFNTNNNRVVNRIVSSHGSSTTNGFLAFVTEGSGTPAERMRIDSSGNLLVGKSGSSLSTAGFELYSSGVQWMTSANARPLLLNRTGSDGAIQEFRKDGTAVGSIGTVSGDFNIFASASGHKGLRLGAGFIAPTSNSTSIEDATTDLGISTARFRSLYLSGGVYLGGTGDANKLDDYEEGTWTPTIIGSTSGSITGFSTSGVVYTKVGEIVTCHAYLTQIDESSSDIVGNIQIGGLPFARGSLAANISVSYCNFAGVTSGEVVQGYASGNSVLLYKGSSTSALTASDIGTGTGKLIMLSITYQTNS